MTIKLWRFIILSRIINPVHFNLNPVSPSSLNPARITLYMTYQNRICNLLILALFVSAPAFSQSPSPKSVQMDTDWEKIRDAQVQMIKKKEADLDRMKEELLARAQPQAQMQTGFPEIEAEIKKREAVWLQKSDRDENEITLLKVKIEEQRSEIESLRVKLDAILKQQPSQSTKLIASPQPTTANLSLQNSAELESREAEFKLKEKQFQERQAEWELKVKNAQQDQAGFEQLKKEKQSFEKERTDWQAAQLQTEQKRNAERIRIEADRRELDALKKSIETDRVAVQGEQKNLSEKSKSLETVKQQTQNLTKLESDLKLKEQQLSTKQLEFDEREKRIADSQKKLVEEKRLWASQKTETDTGLTRKLTDLEARLSLAQNAKQSAESALKGSQIQVDDLKKQAQSAKDSAAEREMNWKKREQDLLQLRDGEGKQAESLQSRLDDLSKKLADAESRFALAQNMKQTAEAVVKNLGVQVDDLKKQVQLGKDSAAESDARWKKREDELLRADAGKGKQADELQSRLDDLTKKLAVSEEEAKKAQMLLQKNTEGFAKQGKDQETEWVNQISDLEKRNTALAAAEENLKKKNNDLEARLLQLEDKLKASLQKHEDASAAARIQPADRVEPKTEAMILELKQKLEQSQIENEKWRSSKKQVEQNWAELVNKEMQYQMEISDLKERNQSLQNQLASTFSVPANAGGKRDWNEESRRVVEERRALGDEKALLYRQLTQDRQGFEQNQVQFSRQQREFEQHVRNEEARLERLRRQSGQN